MSQPHDDTAPVEHDPTGMRALLASLPDPGPMPDDLVARISAALAAEARRATASSSSWHLATTRRRSRAPRRSGCRRAGRAAAPAGRAAAPRGRRCRRRRAGARRLRRRVRAGRRRGVARRGRRSADSGGDRRPDASRPRRGSALVAPGRGLRRGRRRHVRASTTPRTGSRSPPGARRRHASTRSPTSPPSRPRSARSRRRSGRAVCADALGIPADAGLLVDVAEVDGVSAAVARRRTSRPGPHGLGGRPLLHHGHHRPHPWSGAARLSPAGAPRPVARPAGRGRRGNTAAVGSVPRRHRMLRSPPATTTRGCVP